MAIVIFGAGATIGCGGSSANTPPPATSVNGAVDDDATAGVTEHHRYHHHGGVTLFIAMSLDTLGVSTERRPTVEKIRADLQARMEPARSAEQNLMAILADGLAAANFDAAKVDAALAQVNVAASALDEGSADALNELHVALTPPERSALVDKIDSHWAVWQAANAVEAGQANREGGHLARLETELGLTADQVDRIRANLAEGIKAVPRLDPREVATRLRALGDAFRSEKFDARAVTAGSGANAHLVDWAAAHLARFVEAASPVLTADQRAQYVERLRIHAAHNPSAEVSP